MGVDRSSSQKGEALMERHRPPTPPRRFSGAAAADRVIAELGARRAFSETPSCPPLSLLVRVPLRDPESIDAAKCIPASRRHARAQGYLDALDSEVALVVEQIGACRSVACLQVSGATPAAVGKAALGRMMGLLRRSFHLLPGAEMNFSADVRLLGADELAWLRTLGFTSVKPRIDVKRCEDEPLDERDHIGLGVSATGCVGNCLYQNTTSLRTYIAALKAGRLPVKRSVLLDAEARARRRLMAGLRSQGRVDYSALLAQDGVDVPKAFEAEIVRLAPLVARGMVELRGDGIRITPSGREVVDEIARVFERRVS